MFKSKKKSKNQSKFFRIRFNEEDLKLRVVMLTSEKEEDAENYFFMNAAGKEAILPYEYIMIPTKADEIKKREKKDKKINENIKKVNAYFKTTGKEPYFLCQGEKGDLDRCRMETIESVTQENKDLKLLYGEKTDDEKKKKEKGWWDKKFKKDRKGEKWKKRRLPREARNKEEHSPEWEKRILKILYNILQHIFYPYGEKYKTSKRYPNQKPYLHGDHKDKHEHARFVLGQFYIGDESTSKGNPLYYAKQKSSMFDKFGNMAAFACGTNTGPNECTAGGSKAKKPRPKDSSNLADSRYNVKDGEWKIKNIELVDSPPSIDIELDKEMKFNRFKNGMETQRRWIMRKIMEADSSDQIMMESMLDDDDIGRFSGGKRPHFSQYGIITWEMKKGMINKAEEARIKKEKDKAWERRKAAEAAARIIPDNVEYVLVKKEGMIAGNEISFSHNENDYKIKIPGKKEEKVESFITVIGMDFERVKRKLENELFTFSNIFNISDKEISEKEFGTCDGEEAIRNLDILNKLASAEAADILYGKDGKNGLVGGNKIEEEKFLDKYIEDITKDIPDITLF